MKFVERKIKGEIRLDVIYIENKKEKDVDKKNEEENMDNWILIKKNRNGFPVVDKTCGFRNAYEKRTARTY